MTFKGGKSGGRGCDEAVLSISKPDTTKAVKPRATSVTRIFPEE
jgi:hypothetical protein